MVADGAGVKVCALERKNKKCFFILFFACLFVPLQPKLKRIEELKN